ncbi:hypothetical protein D3C71_1742610 [compost metagenome]
MIADVLEWYDSKISLTKMLLSNILSYNNSKISVEDMINGIKAVTINDVVNVANKVDVELIYLLGGENNA